MRNIIALACLSMLMPLAASAGAGQNLQTTRRTPVASQTRPHDSRVDFMQLHTEGSRLFNAGEKEAWLYGVNIASLEWRNDGDHVDQSVERAIKDWKVNLIRLPLAEDRWFGKMKNQTDDGQGYRAIVDRIVDTCAAARVYIDLDLHWSDCGTWVNEGGKLGQHNMPDRNSITFWHDAATRYKNLPNVIFGLYNEPHDTSWSIWLHGGTVNDIPPEWNHDQSRTRFHGVGMQELYDTVRATGATNVVTVAGLDWGYDLSGVLDGYAIKGKDIVYETHPYPFKKDWDTSFGQVAKTYPVYVGEWGFAGRGTDNTNGPAYGQRLMAYIKEHGIQLWTAWDLHPTAGPALIRNWSYEPTPFGSFVRERLTAESVARESGIQ